jgi:hypothetical protein
MLDDIMIILGES